MYWLCLALLVWIVQAFICIKVNIENDTRSPKCFLDLMLLLCLPYILWNKEKIKDPIYALPRVSASSCKKRASSYIDDSENEGP